MGDCASGQVCAAGMCAAPDVSCSATDAPPMPDAGSDAHADAPATGTIIHLHVMGKGTLMIGQTACTNDCMVPVTRGVAVMIVAVNDDDTFQMWTSLACAGQGPTCTLTPIIDMTDVAAKFGKMGPG
jgi:hypothetical protein